MGVRGAGSLILFRKRSNVGRRRPRLVLYLANWCVYETCASPIRQTCETKVAAPIQDLRLGQKETRGAHNKRTQTNRENCRMGSGRRTHQSRMTDTGCKDETSKSQEGPINWPRVQQEAHQNLVMVSNSVGHLPHRTSRPSVHNPVRFRLCHVAHRQLCIEVHHKFDRRFREKPSESDRLDQGNGRRQGGSCRRRNHPVENR